MQQKNSLYQIRYLLGIYIATFIIVYAGFLTLDAGILGFPVRIIFAFVVVILLVNSGYYLYRHHWEMRGEMLQVLHGFQAIDKLIGRVETVLLVLLVLGLVFAEVWGIIAQTCFGHGYTWLKQIFKYTVIWVGLIGASLATQSGNHISISIIPKNLSLQLKCLLIIVINSYAAVVTFMLACIAYDYVVYERLTLASGKTRSNQLQIQDVKIYVPKNKLADLQRRSRNMEQRYQSRLQLMIHQAQQHKNWDVWETELAALREQLNNSREIGEQLQEQKSEWFAAQQPSWRQQLEAAWQESGVQLWKNYRRKTIESEEEKWFRMGWKEQWIARQWQDKWQQQAQIAWQQQGKASCPSDVDIDDFEETWQSAWINKQWQQAWKAEWCKAWENQGRKQYFKGLWSQKWLRHRWQSKWSKQWQAVTTAAHFALKDQQLAANFYRTSWTIPTWVLLLIIPISLFIMSFRFGLHVMNAIVNPKSLLSL